VNERITSAQFMHLWEATNLDTMPHPFEHRTAARSENELFNEKQRLEQWSVGEADPRLREAIAVLRHPDVSVSVFTEGTEPLLVRGAIRGRYAVVAEQEVRTAETGDLRIQVEIGARTPDIGQFVGTLLRGIPAATPGRNRSVDAPPDDLRPGAGSVGVLQSALSSGVDLFKKIVARRKAAGYICIHGRWEGARDSILDSLTWIDVADDGRYLYYTDHLMRLRSATHEVMAENLERRVRGALRAP